MSIDLHLFTEAREAIARLELVSCGTIANPDSDGRGGGDGGIYPAHGHRRVAKNIRLDSGGLRLLGDLEPEFVTLRRRLQRATTDNEARQIRDTALAEHNALTQQAATANPEPGTLQWKRMIANSTLTPTELYRLYGVSRPTIYRYRAQYGDKAA